MPPPCWPGWLPEWRHADSADSSPAPQMKRARPTGAADEAQPRQSPEFEDYTATAAAYDAARRTPALPALLGAVASGRVPLAQADVLELGCGSGNYLHAVKPLCRSVTGVDRNAAMLSRCRAKLQPGEDGARVTLQHGEAEALPFPDASFDAAYACQVFHHFDPADDHAMARQVLRELQRVLRPGGTIFINLCTPKNTSDGLWWSPLIPTATESYCARCIEPEWLRAAWRSLCTTTTPHEAAGVSPASSGCDDGVQWITHNSELFTDASFYMNLAGPLEKSWRDTDSTWAMAAPAELAQALAAIRGMLEDVPKGVQFMEERERQREKVGQSVSCWMRTVG